MSHSARYIILDTEYTNNTREILELSIYDIRGRKLFHSYFKPKRAKNWLLIPHNISPEMVKECKTFEEIRPEIQKILNHATHIVGFAVENDIAVLTQHKIRRLKWKRHVDVRDLYWLAVGKDEGCPLSDTPGLAKCLSSFGLEFGEDGEHSASGDTIGTLRLWQKLLDKFGEKYPEYSESSLSTRCSVIASMLSAERNRLHELKKDRERQKSRERRARNKTKTKSRRRRKQATKSPEVANSSETPSKSLSHNKC